MEIKSGELAFLFEHKGGVAQKINCVMLELSIARTPEDAESQKGGKMMLVIPADHAPKVISSLEVSLARLRQTN